MHDDEVDIDAALVRSLVVAQFPRFAELTITAVRSTGTVNAIYRLGDSLCVRLPRMQEWAADLDREVEWLPTLAPYLTVRVPVPVEKGRPGSGYPFSWAIYEWIGGAPYADDLVDDERQAARDLARFVSEMRRVEPRAAAPRGGRRPLRELDVVTREAVSAARGVIDSDAAVDVWDRALKGPAWTGVPVWVHGDLLRPNLLAHGGRVCAVIDFGAAGIGDPAADVIAAWTVFGRPGREEYRRVLDVDDGTWIRARGFALHQAAMIIPYYRHTNPGFVSLAKRTVEEILADAEP